MLAIDHGYFLGPTSGLEEPYKTVKALLPYADSLMLTRGVLRQCIPPTIDTPIVLRISGGTSILTRTVQRGADRRHRGRHPAERLGDHAVGLRRRRGRARHAAQPGQADRRWSAVRHPRARRHRRGQGDDPRRALSRPGLSHLRRTGRPHGQDLLLRRLRGDRAQHAGAHRHRRRQEDAREGRAADGLQRDPGRGFAAWTWGATSSSPTAPWA